MSHALLSILGRVIVFIARANIPFTMAGLFLLGLGIALLTPSHGLEADTVEYGNRDPDIGTHS
jgi:hypothetical protein